MREVGGEMKILSVERVDVSWWLLKAGWIFFQKGGLPAFPVPVFHSESGVTAAQTHS